MASSIANGAEEQQNVTYNAHGRDNSLMGVDYGASSMQQISYYDYLSRDDEELSREEQ